MFHLGGYASDDWKQVPLLQRCGMFKSVSMSVLCFDHVPQIVFVTVEGWTLAGALFVSIPFCLTRSWPAQGRHGPPDWF